MFTNWNKNMRMKFVNEILWTFLLHLKFSITDHGVTRYYTKGQLKLAYFLTNPWVTLAKLNLEEVGMWTRNLF